MQNKPIIVAFKLKRDIPLLLEMRRYFDMEIVPLLVYDVSHKIFERDSEISRLFPRYVSLPQFYSQTIAELCDMSDMQVLRDIKRFEKQWSLETCAEFVYMDRMAVQEKHFSTQIRHILLWLRLVEHIAEDFQPFFVFRGGHHTIFLNILDRALKAYGIQYLCPRDSTLPGRICYTDEKNRLIGWRYYYDALKANRSRRESKIAKEAMLWLKAFQERPKRPPYSDQCSNVKWDYERMLLDLRLAFDEKKTIGFLNYFFKKSSFDRAMHISGPVGNTLIEEYVKVPLRRVAQKSLALFNEAPDLSAPFFYFPLQFTPEVTTLAYGRGYDDQEHLLTKLAANIPTGAKLYVKEHTSMVGRRPLGMYRRLKRLYNVELVSPAISTFDLIQNCISVTTINSTAGLEAFTLGKPCIFFGHAIYADLKNVFQADITEGLSIKINDFLASFEPDWKDIEDATIAHFECTYKGEVASRLATGYSAIPEGRRENARLLCQSAKDQLELRRKIEST